MPRQAPPSSIALPPQPAIFQHSPSASAPLRKEYEPGCQPDAVYDAALPPWRAALRRWLVARTRAESVWLAKWQKRVRSEGRDKYFYWTALCGTHTFFMTFLPLIFWIGQPERGRAVLLIVELGVYVSSFVKDLACTPRPYSPPIVRITMSTHAHEYGFPSSHTTNSVSLALYMAQWLWEDRKQVGWAPVAVGWTVLAWYAGSVTGGRLYTGMHSIIDVWGGLILGVGSWLSVFLFLAPLEQFIHSGSILVPLLMVPLTLAMVHYHPQPVEDCPCFEDAIAMISVELGGIMAVWSEVRGMSSITSAEARPIFQHGYILGLIWLIARIAIGIPAMFAWRLIAKRTLLTVLPTIFRVFSGVLNVSLPTRKHYVAATDYSGVPPTPIRAMPSFVDLQKLGDESTDASTDASPTPSTDVTPDGVSQPPALNPQLDKTPSPSLLALPNGHNLRRRKNSQDQAPVSANARRKGRKRSASFSEREKYDVEVLTKVGVYTGVGYIAMALVVIVFDKIETALGL